MKEWPQKIDAGKFGICTVREHDDDETSEAHAKGLNYCIPDHGSVNLFHGEKFVAWAGIEWARARIIHG